MSIESLEKPDQARLEKRGEGTRYALVMAGLELFGEQGLEATSTRMLAKKSNANVSAIPYYFGSKEGLYKAVLEYIVQRVKLFFGLLMRDDLFVEDDASLSPEEARQKLHKIVGGAIRLFVESDEPKAWSRLVIREQSNPTKHFDILYDGYLHFIHEKLARYGAAITGLDKDSVEIKLKMHALLGQVLIFLISRESLMRFIGKKKLSENELNQTKEMLLSHVDACLQVKPTGRKS